MPGSAAGGRQHAAGGRQRSAVGGGSRHDARGGHDPGRDRRAKAAIADLRTADEVFVMSKVEANGASAYLVVVPRG